MTRMKTVEANVAQLLELHHHLRNNDNDLIFVYWHEYDNFKNILNTKHLTPASSIIRARAKLQSHGKFLSTDAKVRKHRRIKEKEMLSYVRGR